ncbi:MAG: hypothetical protein HQL19_05775 [Candidatus Omnitrophica bacterium]|nr:hypothetical protein [Candidatus Omnitrophota bacterium]
MVEIKDVQEAQTLTLKALCRTVLVDAQTRMWFRALVVRKRFMSAVRGMPGVGWRYAGLEGLFVLNAAVAALSTLFLVGGALQHHIMLVLGGAAGAFVCYALSLLEGALVAGLLKEYFESRQELFKGKTLYWLGETLASEFGQVPLIFFITRWDGVFRTVILIIVAGCLFIVPRDFFSFLMFVLATMAPVKIALYFSLFFSRARR